MTTASKTETLHSRIKKENARFYQLILRAKIMLETNADRLERRGEDVAHIRAFAKELAQ